MKKEKETKKTNKGDYICPRCGKIMETRPTKLVCPYCGLELKTEYSETEYSEDLKRKEWTAEQWKNSDDDIDRFLYWVNWLSLHNPWKAREAYREKIKDEKERILEALKSKEISPGVMNGKSQFTAEDVYNIITSTKEDKE